MNIAHLICTFAALTLAGCGQSAAQRTEITGKATFAGQPIVYGTIDFSPDDSKDHKGPVGTAEIVDGVYDTSQSGAGIFPGPHRVRVTAFDARPMANMDETTPSQVKPLFTGYLVFADVQPPGYDIDVPETAKGKDFVDPAASSKPRRANDP